MGTQQQMEWRRTKVLDLLAKGYTQQEIADELQFDKSTISKDVKFLREESKERIRTHLEERLPLEYETCLRTLMDTRRRAYAIADKDNLDEKTKLEATKIINDSTMKYMDILTHNETIKTVMNWNNKVNKQLESTTADSIKDKANNEETSNEAVDTNSNDTTRTSEDSTADTAESEPEAATTTTNDSEQHQPVF